MKKFAIISIILCISVLSNAQRFTSFSGDPSKTVEEMKEFYASVPKDRQKEAKEILDQFEQMWTTRMDMDNQEVFIAEANKMVKKKYRPIPHFQSFIQTYDIFLRASTPASPRPGRRFSTTTSGRVPPSSRGKWNSTRVSSGTTS